MTAIRLDKVVLGIRPEKPMFRLSSYSGEMIDDLLSRRGSGFFEKEYYDNVAFGERNELFRLYGMDGLNHFHIDSSNIVFKKASYGTDSESNLEKSLHEFCKIYEWVDDILEVGTIRRLGIVGEFRTTTQNQYINKHAINSLTNFEAGNMSAKFGLRFENRINTIEGAAIDVKTSDFFNVIYHIYDGVRDTEFPEEDVLNINIDVQRYFAPPISGNIKRDVEKLQKKFNIEAEKLNTTLKSLGLFE